MYSGRKSKMTTLKRNPVVSWLPKVRLIALDGKAERQFARLPEGAETIFDIAVRQAAIGRRFNR